MTGYKNSALLKKIVRVLGVMNDRKSGKTLNIHGKICRERLVILCMAAITVRIQACIPKVNPCKTNPNTDPMTPPATSPFNPRLILMSPPVIAEV